MSGASLPVTHRNHLLTVTGASRGFGHAAAKALVQWLLTKTDAAENVAETTTKVHVLLLARSSAALEALAAELRQLGAGAAHAEVIVHLNAVDLAQGVELKAALDSMFSALAGFHFQSAFLVNNAGSLGDLGRKVCDIDSFDFVQQYMNLNVTSVVYLTARFLRTFASVSESVRVINISSLLAVQPFPYWGLYSTGKAARDMLHKVVALEADKDRVKTINYSPGPLDNDMQLEVRSTIGDPAQKAIYGGMHSEGKLVPVDHSIAKLVRLLKDDTFESGAHVDYYDE